MTKAEAASFYARSGKVVFPCHYINEVGGCSCGKECGSAGKHPMWHKDDLPHGRNSASSDEAQVAAWWLRWPDANIGMPTGRVNGIIAYDADVKDGKQGLESLRAIMNGTKPEDTLCSRTGSGGLHVMFSILTDDPIPTIIGYRPHLDLMADNGYTLVEPSNHASGGTYQWLSHKRPLPLPDYLRKLIVTQTSETTETTEKAAVSQEDWAQRIYKSSPSRNKYITRLAGSLFRSGVPPSDALDILLLKNQSNCVPPLTRQEVMKICRSCSRMERVRRERVKTEREQTSSEKETERIVAFTSLASYMEDYGGTETAWAIPEWLPVGTCGFVSGPPESWKTWLLMDMAVSIATGKDFLGHFPVEHKGPVLWVQQEDSHPMLANRFGRMFDLARPTVEGRTLSIQLPPDDVPLHVHRERRFTLRSPQSIVDLERAIRDYKATMVIIDPLYSMMVMDDYGAKSAQEMLLFKKMRDEYGCSFIIGHHMKKGDTAGTRTRDRGWGSQFLNAWIEMGIEMLPADTPPGRVTVERHAKGEGRPKLLDLQWNVREWDYDVEIIEAKPPETTLTEVIAEAIHTQSIGSYKELMDVTGIRSRTVISKALAELGAIKLEDHYVLKADIVMPTFTKGMETP